MLDPRFWPSWRYGPGGAAAIFERPEDVPEGWEDHPSKVVDDAPVAVEAPAKRGPGRPRRDAA